MRDEGARSLRPRIAALRLRNTFMTQKGSSGIKSFNFDLTYGCNCENKPESIIGLLVLFYV